MILSRAKPAIAAAPGSQDGTASSSTPSAVTKQLPKLEDFLSQRDYTGAMSLLEFNRNSGKGNETLDMWLGYCAFHAGDYKRYDSENLWVIEIQSSLAITIYAA